MAVTQSFHYHADSGKPGALYTAVGELPGVPGVTFFSTRTYDLLGNVDTIGYPCRTSNCSGDERTRTIDYDYTYGSLSAVAGWASSITWHPSGTIDTVTHGSGAAVILESWTADPNGMPRPRSIQAKNNSGAILWTTGNYAYDGSGNITDIGPNRYTYDRFQRLTGWTTILSGSTLSTSVGYDDYGNQLYAQQEGCGASGICYSPGFLPRAMRGTTNHYANFVYDSAGNLVADDLRTFTWDRLGMVSRTETQGRDFRFLYTAGGERVAAIERRTTPTGSVYDTAYTLRDFDNRLLSVFRTDTAGIPRWSEDAIWRNNALLGHDTAQNGIRHYTLDHLGSPRLITTATGQIAGTQTFAPFGDGGTSAGGALQFTAHERDTALLAGGLASMPDYMHARYYSSAMGRFLSVDPAMDVERNLRTPQRWNRYAYALNNPIKYVDPDGMTERTGWQAGVVVNKSNQVIWIAADHNGAKVVIPLLPGERSTSFLVDTDAVIIGPGQKIDGKGTGAFKIGSSDVDVEGKNASKLELDADGEWVVNSAAGRAGHVSPTTAQQNGWVIPAGQQGAQAAEKTKQQLQQERQREEQKNKPQPQPQPKPQPKKERDWWPFW